VDISAMTYAIIMSPEFAYDSNPYKIL